MMPIIPFILLGALALFFLDRASTPQALNNDGAEGASSVPTAISEVVGNVKATMAKLFGTPYDDLIESAAAQYKLDPVILWRLFYAESHFREDIISGAVVSPVGALGIAQFMPATAAQFGIDPLDPVQAIPAAASYLSSLISTLGSIDAGVAAYNWGIGNVQRKGLAKAPKETVEYVALVTGNDITQG